MKEYKATQKYPTDDVSWSKNIYIFLGGSIEMGAAEKWQDRLVEEFSDVPNIVFLNPRRDDWDSSWDQDPTPGTQFREQVDWEMESQELADICIYYFADNTKSPITLLELGAYSGQSIVRCTPNFWRHGNVAAFCDRYGIPIVDDFESMVVALKDKIAREKAFKGIAG